MRCSRAARLRNASCSDLDANELVPNCMNGTKWHQVTSEAMAKLLILWWAQQDSNLRLPPCEGITPHAFY
jgi:hypothetical protein